MMLSENTRKSIKHMSKKIESVKNYIDIYLLLIFEEWERTTTTWASAPFVVVLNLLKQQ